MVFEMAYQETISKMFSKLIQGKPFISLKVIYSQ